MTQASEFDASAKRFAQTVGILRIRCATEILIVEQKGRPDRWELPGRAIDHLALEYKRMHGLALAVTGLHFPFKYLQAMEMAIPTVGLTQFRLYQAVLEPKDWKDLTSTRTRDRTRKQCIDLSEVRGYLRPREVALCLA